MTNLATQPATKPGDTDRNKPSPDWQVGNTQWARDHFHQKLVINVTPSQIGFPPHQILPYHTPKSQNSGLEDHNIG